MPARTGAATESAGTLQVVSAGESPAPPSGELLCMLCNGGAWLGVYLLVAFGRDEPMIWGVTAILLLTYWIYAGQHPALRYLLNLNPIEDVVAYVKRIEAAAPTISFHGECYHYETRTRWVTETYTDYETRHDFSSGRLETVPVTRTRQKLETYQERITTHTATEEFKFSAWRDQTRKLSGAIYHYQATRVAFALAVTPGDSETAAAFEAARTAFQDAHKDCDVHFDFSENIRVEGFKPRMLSIVDLSNKSPAMNSATYILFAAIGLGWPYLLWFNHRTVQGTFTFTKTFSIRA